MDRRHSRQTPHDPAFPTCEHTYAELRIYPGEISPDDVTTILGITPTQACRVGDRTTNSLGRERIAKISGWFLSSESSISSLDLRSHLDWLLDCLEPAGAGLARLQQRPGVQMAVHCTWWSAHGDGGPVLWPEQMARLAALDLECGLSVAFYGDEE